jgi:hypothetical protein
LDTQQNWCASDKFIIYWHVNGVAFPKKEVDLFFFSRVEGSRVLDLIRLIQPRHIIPVVSLMRSRVTVVFPKALGAAVGSRVMAAGSGSFFVFVYLKYLLRTEQFALNKGCLCDGMNITVNPLLVFNPEGQAF